MHLTHKFARSTDATMADFSLPSLHRRVAAFSHEVSHQLFICVPGFIFVGLMHALSSDIVHVRLPSGDNMVVSGKGVVIELVKDIPSRW
jgi:hypothetical protein